MKHLTSPESEMVQKIMNKIPKDVLDQLFVAMNKLELTLLAKDPLMPNHLRESHRLLITYPESVHLLDDNEIARIIAASEAHAQITVIKEPAKKGPSKKKVDVSNL